MLRYLTAGESHGKGLMAILDGVPSGLAMDEALINLELSRRMFGYGRGGRMDIEADTAEVVAGCRKKRTIGSPIGLLVKNRDHKINELPAVKDPRPGHADLAGVQKYAHSDARDVLERASARETAARVACGAVAKMILKEFGIRVLSHVVEIGGVKADTKGLSADEIAEKADMSSSRLRCADPAAEKEMCRVIDEAKQAGDTLGGGFEVIVENAPPGLGTYAQWDRRLDGALARAVMSIPAVKAVSIGEGIRAASSKGSEVHDAVKYDSARKRFIRDTNNAGGLEGGVTNGEPVVVRGYMKPIATLSSPLETVNLDSKKNSSASTERSDVCAVSACGVIAEAVIAMEIASALLEKLGGDSMVEIKRNYEGYLKQLTEV